MNAFLRWRLAFWRWWFVIHCSLTFITIMNDFHLKLNFPTNYWGLSCLGMPKLSAILNHNEFLIMDGISLMRWNWILSSYPISKIGTVIVVAKVFWLDLISFICIMWNDFVVFSCLYYCSNGRADIHCIADCSCTDSSPHLLNQFHSFVSSGEEFWIRWFFSPSDCWVWYCMICKLWCSTRGWSMDPLVAKFQWWFEFQNRPG